MTIKDLKPPSLSLIYLACFYDPLGHVFALSESRNEFMTACVSESPGYLKVKVICDWPLATSIVYEREGEFLKAIIRPWLHICFLKIHFYIGLHILIPFT